MADNATGLELVYDLIKANSPTGATFMSYTPDVAGIVREVVEGEAPPELTMGPEIAIERQVIDIGVRGTPEDYATPRNEAIRLRKLIYAAQDYTSRGLVLLAAMPIGGIRPDGRDEQKREQFSISFNVWIQDAPL